MRKLCVMLMAMASLFIFCAASYAAEDKVGYIDDIAVLDNYPKFQNAQKQLEALYDKKSAAAEAAIKKEKDDKKKAAIAQNFQHEMETERVKLVTPVYQEVNAKIASVAKKMGVTIVMNKSAVYFGGVDITQEVIKTLKTK
ncbi:MAG: OmpH family outer membrane protein [Synergistes sp.]|nr:OmpH family outer membrane protein [Synergistes sp.]